MCQNGGTCRQPDTGGLPICRCLPGYTGARCETTALRSCSSHTCANGGRCHDAPDGGPRCDCAPGFGGEDCSERRPCAPDTCLNGAPCRDAEDGGGFQCQCPAGYHGARCQHGQSSLASNVSHRVSSEEGEQPLSRRQVALIASLSSVLPVLALLLCCVVCCALRRRRRRSQAPKECRDLEVVEDERLQNERNALQHMNNKQCPPHKIVNALDRLPPKVLNVEPGHHQKVLDKGLVCPQRTLTAKKDNASAAIR